MTRGKHGVSAAAKKAVSEGEQQIAAYQHNVRKLTVENAKLRQKIEDLQASHSKTVHVLKVERDEGLSPMLSGLQKENQKLQERARLAEHALQAAREAFRQAGVRVIGHFRSSHGLTHLEAIEEATKFLTDMDSSFVPGDYRAASKGGTVTALRAIQRARGDRR